MAELPMEKIIELPQQCFDVAEGVDDVGEMLNREAAGLQASVGDQARVQDEKKRRQDQISQCRRVVNRNNIWAGLRIIIYISQALVLERS